MIKFAIKIIRINITIIIITLLIVFQSTNVISQENYFQITNYEIKEKITTNFSREKIIEKTFNKTFKQLLTQILLSKDLDYIKKIKLVDIKSFVNSFQIYDESFSGREYVAKFNIYFNKEKLGLFLAKHNLIFSEPKKVSIMFFPIILDNNKILLFEDNIIYQNFLDSSYKEENIISYIIPVNEIDELLTIEKNKNEIESYDFFYLAKKYNVENYVVTITNIQKKKSKILIKMNFVEKKFVKVIDYDFSDLKNSDNLLKVVVDIKKNILDNWKKINSVNLYEPVKLNFEFNHQNIQELEKLESVLKEINIITEYSILEHNNENTKFYIEYFGNPKRLSKELLNLDYELIDQQGTWLIKRNE